MAFTNRMSFLCLALLAASCSRPADDERAIREHIANYTKALDTGDLGLAARVWWDTKDVSAITPMGHSHGWDEVKGITSSLPTISPIATSRRATSPSI